VHVPFVELKGLRSRDEVEVALSRVFASGRYLYGPEVESFELAFASYTGTAHCVGMANGLDALRLTLRAWITLGVIDYGDDVIVPANSFVASALAVTESGLNVSFADVSPVTFNVTIETITAALTARTRVVMVVHLYGQISDIDRIRSLCEERGLLLLEDAAQAHGARSGLGSSGSFGHAGGFSFYPTKNLGALGDGGCMVTNDARLAERVRCLGNYGSRAKYNHEFAGVNSRLAELQAAVLAVKLKYLDDENARRREIANQYAARIQNPFVVVPAMPSEPSAHVWHLFVVTTRYRASLIRHLDENSVETMIHYPCAIHLQPAFATKVRVTHAPVSERLQNEVLSLPIGPTINEQQVERVISAVNGWRGPQSNLTSRP
jgi:dTDP-4-amino-4,6-dideoxygalactose transaminase